MAYNTNSIIRKYEGIVNQEKFLIILSSTMMKHKLLQINLITYLQRKHLKNQAELAL